MAKKRQTFGKMQRERERAEKRARKQEKKDEKKAAAAAARDAEAGDDVPQVDIVGDETPISPAEEQ